MKYEAQRKRKAELDARVPKGPKGSPQNEFRFAVNFFRSQGYSFDASVAMATDKTREHHPEFSPVVKPSAAQ